MLTVQIWNVSDLAPVSDYHYAVYINREQIATGSVLGHTREDGWAVLLKKLADEHIAVTKIERDGRVIGTQQATVREFIACGRKSPRSNRICVSANTPGHTCKFVKIVPAKRPGVKR
jgi:hypothetical protein